MDKEEITRKDLDNQEFLKLRKATEKIGVVLEKRLKNHLTVLRPLFMPRKLFGTYIKSSAMQEVPGADKAFAGLQEQYGMICKNPFDLPKKLQPPLPPISNELQGSPLEYTLDSGRGTKITSSTRWVLSYRGECPLSRLRAMVSGKETRQVDDIRQALIDHLSLVVFLKHFPALTQLFQDLRYGVDIKRMPDLGGLPVVVLEAPLDTFLPTDDFIEQVTQLSGVPAFQEIIDMGAVHNMSDPLKEVLKTTLTQS